VTGTPFELTYSSARQPGGVPPLEIPLASAPLPPGLRSIELEISIAGRQFRFSVAPPSVSQLPLRHHFQWDGLDAFGRRVYGRQPISTAIGYTFGGSYQRTNRFGYNGNGVAITASRDRFEATLWQRWSGWLDQWNARSSGLGGWSLNVHHAFDPRTAVVYLGNGAKLDGSLAVPKLVTIAGNGQTGFSGDGGPATQAQLNLQPSLSNSSLAVASDGTVYFTDAANNRIRKVDRDGIITTIAGGGTATTSPFGDGGPATNATFSTPTGVAIGADGSVYVTDKYHDRIRKIDPSGMITTVAGNGTYGVNGDGPALTRSLGNPTGIAIATDGTIYFTDGRLRRLKDGIVSMVPNAPVWYLTQPAVGKDGSIFFSNYSTSQIQRIGVNGLLSTYAGSGASGTYPYGEGGPAASAQVLQPDGVAVGPDGIVYLVDTGHHMIRRVNGDGTIETVVGSGTAGYNGESLPATRANISRPRGFGLGPDGAIYVVDTDNQRIRKTTRPPAAASSDGSLSVASFDGRRVFVFSSLGRHLKTVDSFTGVTQLAFEYDAIGRLMAVADRELTDPNARVTHIDRDASGRALGVISPDGQYTVLEVDLSDDLRSVTDPAGGIYSFDYATGGMLIGMRDPKGNAEGTAAYEFVYDGGRLVRDEDPLGHAQTLVRTNLPQGSRVTHATPLGRATFYDRQNPDPLLVDQRITGPDGLTTQRLTRLDGKPFVAAPNGKSYSGQISRPDRSSVFLQHDPDSLFGTQAPVLSESIEIMGSGAGALTRTTQSTRSIVRAAAGDPHSVVQATLDQTVNGKTVSSFYSAATRTFTVTSPAGRRSFRSIDALGRTVRAEIEGLLPAEFIYDDAGRLLQTIQGDRVSDFTYVQSNDTTNGYLESMTNAEGHVTTYMPDALGRVLQETVGGATTSFGYDPNGNPTAVAPPGQPEHGQSYTALNQMSSYSPPSAGLPTFTTGYTYTHDRDPLSVTRPDGITVAHNYDSAGRLDTLTFGANLVDYDYYANVTGAGVAPGRVSAVRGPYGVDVTYGYLGQLTTSTAWTGLVQGSIVWTYDSDFRKAIETVTASTDTSTTRFGYDTDSLLTCASPTSCSPPAPDALTMTRHPQHGAVTGITLGSTSETLTHNAYGELSRRELTYAGNPIYGIAYDTLDAPRDDLGRIVRKTETVQGATRVNEYTYDARGRLTDVYVDGIPARHWEYDGNGNRTLASTPTETVTGTYDDQDRLIEYGDWAFTYGDNGELESKTNTLTSELTTYDYDALGNLRGVSLPDGNAIEYLADGLGRRVAKRVNGTIVRRWIYENALKPIAELDGAGALVSRFVYASSPMVPDFVIRGGATYRIVSDQLGSPRLVIDVATGAVAQRLRHDEFGNVLEDTAPGFIPLGFAGGLYDSQTGLLRFGARDYDPHTGRWTSKDPIRFDSGDGANLYTYVENDPVNATDLTGLSKYDKLFGLPKKFWKWFHRQIKEPGDPDLTKDEAEALCKEWKDLGKPGPDKKGPKGPTNPDGGPFDDFIDLIPFPLIPTCLLDGSCFGKPEGA
jgi:RHS repeat-associated protein